MNKLNFRISKWIIGLFLLSLLLIIGTSTNWFQSWGIDYNLFFHELGYGILIGLIPSVLIAFISFKEQFEQQLEILGISKEIINAGVSLIITRIGIFQFSKISLKRQMRWKFI